MTPERKPGAGDDRYRVVAGAFLVMTLAWGIYYSFGVFMIPLLEAFGWTRANTAGAFAIAVFVEGLGGIVVGRIADRLGIRLVMVGCGILIFSACIGMAFIRNLWQFYVCYGLCLGLGLSCTYTPLASTIARRFKRQRGFMLGIVVSGLGVGSLLITPVADGLIRRFSWRVAFVVMGCVALTAIIGITRCLRLSSASIRHSGSDAAMNDKSHIRAISSADKQLLPTGGRRQLILMCGVLLCWGYAAYGVMAHFVAYAVSRNIHPSQAALALAFMGGMISLDKIIIGLGADRLGNKATLVTALTMMFASMLWLKHAVGLWEFYLFALFFAFGFACASVVMPGLVAESFGLRSHGLLLGITNVFACAGCAVGPVLTGHLYDINGNYDKALWVFVVFGLVSVLIATGLSASSRSGY